MKNYRLRKEAVPFFKEKLAKTDPVLGSYDRDHFSKCRYCSVFKDYMIGSDMCQLCENFISQNSSTTTCKAMNLALEIDAEELIKLKNKKLHRNIFIPNTEME